MEPRELQGGRKEGRGGGGEKKQWGEKVHHVQLSKTEDFFTWERRKKKLREKKKEKKTEKMPKFLSVSESFR